MNGDFSSNLFITFVYFIHSCYCEENNDSCERNNRSQIDFLPKKFSYIIGIILYLYACPLPKCRSRQQKSTLRNGSVLFLYIENYKRRASF